MSKDLYDARFYTEAFAGSARSGRKMLGLLFPVLQPHSVADFGCGVGAWLAAAGSLGAEVLHGFDGPWVDRQNLADPRIVFAPIDFRGDIAFAQRFDLAMSVEVAEHLPESRADWFVETLCRASDVVLFGAAVPGQGGVDHINEQWPSYWREKFVAQGYTPVDFFRPHVWDDDDIDWYYRQNTFLYVRTGSPLHDRLASVARTDVALMDAAHPVLVTFRMRQRDGFWRAINQPTLLDCANVLANFVKTQVKRVIGRR